ncbi:O-antigen ligase family protein [Magnetospirillum sp. 15-1]|uniref:O-antigen ligase family protein n=1 Tax=Magnetospirillum sp. 15-1 TaxID=1979370 RepID=UPI001483270C|nr:O-antigen ligase family protein [Magnetospirillum sp. 15-1]
MATLSSVLTHPEAPLVLAAIMAGPVAVLAPLGCAPLMVVVATALLAQSRGRLPWRSLDRHLVLLLATLAAYASLSVLWSDQPLTTVAGSLSLIGTLICGVIVLGTAATLSAEGRQRVELALALGVILGFVALAALQFNIRLTAQSEYMTRLRLSLLSRGVIVVSLLLWPTLLVLRHRPLPSALVAVLATGTILSSDIGGAKLGLAGGLLCGLAGLAAPRLAGRAMGYGAAILVIAAPFLALKLPEPQGVMDHWPQFSTSALHRMVIWNFTAEHIIERPILGWGLESSRWIPGADDDTRVTVKRNGDDAVMPLTHLPLHPHNAPLQWWLELGLVGAAILAYGIIRVTGALPAALDRASRFTAFGTTGAVLAVSCVSFGAWQKWWLAAAWLLASFTVIAIRSGNARAAGR